MASRRHDSSGHTRSRDRAGARAERDTGAHDESEAGDASRTQLLQSVQQLLMAGMTAFARAQKVGGPAAFQEAMVESLRVLGRSGNAAQSMVKDAFEMAQETLQSRVGNARGQAQETMDNIEALFQSRVQRTLQQLGVPTAEEIRVLTKRVAELNANVSELNQKQRAPRPAAVKKRGAPARAASARKAPARRAPTRRKAKAPAGGG